MEIILAGLVIGVGGTVAMDAWALVLHKLADVPLPNWGNVGRWFGYIPQGTVFHKDISAAEALPNEVRLGWLAHYSVGAIYGMIWAIFAGSAWLATPTFGPVWPFAIVTMVAGWFLLHPGMGLGWAASKTPNPWKVRGFGLLAHTAFGLGMWLTALIL